MNSVSLASPELEQTTQPLNLLEQLSISQASGCLQVNFQSVFYWIYLEDGKILYATHSVAPFERLERHLRNFSSKIKTLTQELLDQLRLKFEGELKNVALPSDYQAICWLVQQEYLKVSEAAQLIKYLVREFFESYLLIPAVNTSLLTPDAPHFPIFCRLDTQLFINACSKRIKAWQAFSPQVSSPYQRPYFFPNPSAKEKLSSEQQKKLGGLLKGFSFRQLAVLLRQDELTLIKKLYPLILDQTILLREPQYPFDKLPQISGYLPLHDSDELVLPENHSPEIIQQSLEQRHYKVACIDDSPTMLQEISRFLESDQFSVTVIQDSVKALRSIIRVNPDIILMDVGMPTIDGYKLCSMIRKHSLFKKTPIIMVTGNKGVIDRVKAKLVGATDYMTKPFSREELLNMISGYLA